MQQPVPYGQPWPTGLAIASTMDDELFDTHFPRPPPRRSKTQAERLARPSLPSLTNQFQADLSLSSRDSSQQMSTSLSTGSGGSFSSYPSSTSALSLLRSRHPLLCNSTRSSGDYSPVDSNLNGAETDSRGLSLVLSELEQSGPSTPITPNFVAHTWRPRELNLVKKQTQSSIAESSLSPYATPLWHSHGPEQLTESPSVGAVEIGPDSDASHPVTSSSNGPRKLLLSTSGGPPPLKRFPGQRPSDSAIDLLAPYREVQSSSSGALRSPLPILPSTPTFTSADLRTTDTAKAEAETSASLPSAQKFLAQIASQPEYEASEYLDSTKSLLFLRSDAVATEELSAESSSHCQKFATANNLGVYLDVEQPSHVAKSDSKLGKGCNLPAAHDSRPTVTETTPGPMKIASRKSGFSSAERSRSASVSRRKAPPSPLLFTSASTRDSEHSSLTRAALTASHVQNLPTSMSAQPDFESRTRSSAGKHSAAISDKDPLPTAFFDCQLTPEQDSLQTANFGDAALSEGTVLAAERRHDEQDFAHPKPLPSTTWQDSELSVFGKEDFARHTAQDNVLSPCTVEAQTTEARVRSQSAPDECDGNACATGEPVEVLDTAAPFCHTQFPVFDTEIFRPRSQVPSQQGPWACVEIDPKEIHEVPPYDLKRQDADCSARYNIKGIATQDHQSSRSISSPCLPFSASQRITTLANPTSTSTRLQMINTTFDPAPPSFATQDASSGLPISPKLSEAKRDFSRQSQMPSVSVDQSRWSSGSEADEGTAKVGRGKAFSMKKKSFSSRKSNLTQYGEPFNGQERNQDRVDRPRTVSRASRKISSSTQDFEQEDTVALKVSAPLAARRPLLSGFSSFRKKSYTNSSSQIITLPTPACSNEPSSVSLVSPNIGEFSVSQLGDSGDAPSPFWSRSSATSLERTVDVSSGATDVFAAVQPVPVLPSAPLTTKQILAHAQRNVWPGEHVGSGFGSSGAPLPYVNDRDMLERHLMASRPAILRPTESSFQKTETHSHTRSVRERLRSFSTFRTVKPADLDAVKNQFELSDNVPPSPGQGAMPTRRNISQHRQSPEVSHSEQHEDLPNDSLQPVALQNDLSEMGVDPRVANTNLIAGQRSSSSNVCENAIFSQAIAVDATKGDVAFKAKPFSSEASDVPKRASANLRQNRSSRYPRYTSLSEFGLQWVTDQADAFSVLMLEPRPFKAAIQASGKAVGSVLAGGHGGGGGDDDDDESDTDDYGSSDGGGGAGGGGYGSYNAGGNGGKQPSRDGDDDDDDDRKGSTDEEESHSDDTSTDEDPEDDDDRNKSGSSVRPMKASMEHRSARADDYTLSDTDSSDDRPLGQLVDDPRAVQKALQMQERKRHFALAHQALNGEGSTGTSRPDSSNARRTVAPLETAEPLDANDLNRRLIRMQRRNDRAEKVVKRPLQQPQTPTGREGGARAEPPRAHGEGPLRSKSVKHPPAERLVHPGLRTRTPSEAALRAKAMSHSTVEAHSPLSPTFPGMSQMPDLPPYAMAAVAAAQKALAQAQANPTSASVAQANALAASATAALNSATANVLKNSSSPVSPTFGDQMHQSTTALGESESAPIHVRSAPPGHVARSAAPSGKLEIRPHLPSRSTSRAQVPFVINTSLAPPASDLPKLMNSVPNAASAATSPPSRHLAVSSAMVSAAPYEGLTLADGSATNDGTRMSIDQSSNSAHGDGNRLTGYNRGLSPLEGAVADNHLAFKIFILSRQRFTRADVPVSARARDLVLNVVEKENLPMDDARGGWVLFDCSQQFGIERPLREYELVNEVVDVRANSHHDYFLLKHTELAPYLSLRSIPQSSPELAGYVYVQDRKKKWTKRWLELRDHGLYHAKNEKGKDETFICQISTFDVYLVDASVIKMPKAAGFALRSQDKISMFEKPDQDYIHYFSLTDPAAHRDWVRAILNARSYVLRQERAILFQTDMARADSNALTSPAIGGGLSRRPTARAPNGRPGASDSGHPHFPASPLIDSTAFAGPFAKGSLLADKAISDAKEAIRVHPSPGMASAMNDLSLAERNAVRLHELRRMEAVAERHKQAKTDNQPLIDLSRK